VFKAPVRSGQAAQSYFEHERVQISSDPAVVRVSDLREIEVPHGIIYTLTSVAIRSASGRRSETLYGSFIQATNTDSGQVPRFL
jgi:hypothetical protein